MKDEGAINEQVVAAVDLKMHSIVSPAPNLQNVTTFHNCRGTNHLAKDCLNQCSFGGLWYILWNCLGNGPRVEISANLASHPNVNIVLPMINVQVDEEWYPALIDSGYTLIIVDMKLCCKWTKVYINVETI